MTTTTLDAQTTMGEALATYFRDNKLGEDGGYSQSWVRFDFGPVPFWIPNPQARKEAVRFHDMNHMLTGYRTVWQGEFEISSYEIASGCGRYSFAWMINLGGLAAGAMFIPRRTWAAFRRGLHARSLYLEDYDRLLPMTLEQLRELTGIDQPLPPPSWRERLSFLSWTALGLLVGLPQLLPFAIPPALLLWGAWSFFS